MMVKTATAPREPTGELVSISVGEGLPPRVILEVRNEGQGIFVELSPTDARRWARDLGIMARSANQIS